MYSQTSFPGLSSFQVTLAISGLAIVLLSIVSSAGFFGYLGVSCAMIIFQILPFLVLAVGVDNIFIFVQTLQSVTAENPDLVGALATSCSDSRNLLQCNLISGDRGGPFAGCGRGRPIHVSVLGRAGHHLLSGFAV